MNLKRRILRWRWLREENDLLVCFNLYFDVATHSCIFWLTLRVSPLWAKIDSEKATNGYMFLLLVWIKKAYKEFTRFNLFSVIPLLSASVKLSVSFALWQLSVSHAYAYCISSNEHPCSVSAFPRITPHSQGNRLSAHRLIGWWVIPDFLTCSVLFDDYSVYCFLK